MPSYDFPTWFRSYRPQDVPAAEWEEHLRPFVAACIADLGDVPRPAAVLRYVQVLTGLADWCTRQGLPLQREVILSPEVVEHYAAQALTGRSGATYRADLRRLGPALTTRAAWPPRPAALASRQVAAPYTDDELEGLWRAVDRQPTAISRQRGRALYLLGAGAGLDGRWVTTVAAADVLTDDGVLIVSVGEPHPRGVPVLDRFAGRLNELADEIGSGSLTGLNPADKNAASQALVKLKLPPGVARPSLRRLRATWLRTHLERRTRLPELVAAAGLMGLTVLSDLVASLEPLPTGQAAREVAGLEADRGHREDDPRP